MFVNGEEIDDVKIVASAPFIDGRSGILGQAGPTSVRNGSFLTATGIMLFDSADLTALQASGQLVDTIVHEMGHVLGIGTLWAAFFPQLVSGIGTSNPRFTGAKATQQYNDIFGVNKSSVPLENIGEPGTKDSHWREATLDSELMTGYLNQGSNSLTKITIGALEDMGYLVNYGAANAFTPPSSLVAVNQTSGQSSGASLVGAPHHPFEEPHSHSDDFHLYGTNPSSIMIV